ncbi:hypothetical protein GNI_134760 [Gregarina niphandrodes]|uniref:Uncharacterized protein n=1 Tax=Gregarina niphandrodes TaxID=110365 RepID=A0A023B0Y5_GRENI|nr:hypothetical protein GNI_134760 [Gregarina niphandrodes]EZG46156.1 hypothetical protein GNI_134760 [Gregarina niphandrodes]|eukprot:XP_011132352.1 hypothetical protein GNI_134760 [Gregarina niphandrodes]
MTPIWTGRNIASHCIPREAWAVGLQFTYSCSLLLSFDQLVPLGDGCLTSFGLRNTFVDREKKIPIIRLQPLLVTTTRDDHSLNDASLNAASLNAARLRVGVEIHHVKARSKTTTTQTAVQTALQNTDAGLTVGDRVTCLPRMSTGTVSCTSTSLEDHQKFAKWQDLARYWSVLHGVQLADEPRCATVQFSRSLSLTYPLQCIVFGEVAFGALCTTLEAPRWESNIAAMLTSAKLDPFDVHVVTKTTHGSNGPATGLAATGLVVKGEKELLSMGPREQTVDPLGRDKAGAYLGLDSNAWMLGVGTEALRPGMVPRSTIAQLLADTFDDLEVLESQLKEKTPEASTK